MKPSRTSRPEQDQAKPRSIGAKTQLLQSCQEAKSALRGCSALLTPRCNSPVVVGIRPGGLGGSARAEARAFGGCWKEPPVFSHFDMSQKSQVWGFALSGGIHLHPHTHAHPAPRETPPPSEPGWKLPNPSHSGNRIFKDL